MNKIRNTNHYSDKILKVTLASIGILLLLHWLALLLVRYGGIEHIGLYELLWRFNVDYELNVPTWYASFLAAAAGLVAIFIGAQHRLKRNANKGKPGVWYLIAAASFFISVDETASFHELALQTMHVQAGFGVEQSYSENAWLLLMPLILAGLVAAVYVMYRQLPRRTFQRLVVALGVYAFGAVAMEYFSIPFDTSSVMYGFVLTPLEEGLELVGIWLVLRSMVLYVREELPATDKKLSALWQ